jgi:hypothetical protein
MAALSQWKTRVTADYDRAADVLYVTLATPVPDEGEDAPRGVILRYSMKDNSPTGATVVGLANNNWLTEVDNLSTILSKHMKTNSNEIKEAILDAVGGMQ